jgi:hypothetical protein
MESIVCTAENWREVCTQLQSKREEFLEKFDDNCFYIAYANEGYPRDLVFWRLKNKTAEQMADFISDAAGSHYGFKYGWAKWTKLQEDIDKNRITLIGMECHHGYPRFEVVKEINMNLFPILKPQCLENDHYEWDDFEVTSVSNNSVERGLMDFFKDIREHNAIDCKIEEESTDDDDDDDDDDGDDVCEHMDEDDDNDDVVKFEYKLKEM